MPAPRSFCPIELRILRRSDSNEAAAIYNLDMSTGRRAYDLLRGYVNHEWERIKGIDGLDPAEEELNAALAGPGYRRTAYSEETQVEMVQLSEEDLARQILGVTPTATFDEIRKAFDKLNQRSDPKNFPSGSIEAENAAEIRSRVHRAFRILSDKFDATETRFKSLEID